MSVVLWKKIWNLPPHLPGKPVIVVLICLLSAHWTVQSLSRVWLFATPWTAAHQAFLSITNCQSLLKLMSIKSVDATQLSHSVSSPSLPVFNLSQHQGVFQRVSSSHQVAKVLEFQLQHQSFQWTFRTDFLYNWLIWSPCSPRDSQESSQHHSLKASVLWCSAF